MRSVRLLLDNIRSAHNVGSIFRTADAAAVEHMYLCGITPAPTDRFGRTHAEIKKTALGATQMVPWQQVGDGSDLATDKIVALIKALQHDGFITVAVEQHPEAIELFTFQAPEKVVYVFGGEVAGVQPEILSTVDLKVEIPMAGTKESLNVSVTAGIILFQKF